MWLLSHHSHWINWVSIRVTIFRVCCGFPNALQSVWCGRLSNGGWYDERQVNVRLSMQKKKKEQFKWGIWKEGRKTHECNYHGLTNLFVALKLSTTIFNLIWQHTQPIKFQIVISLLLVVQIAAEGTAAHEARIKISEPSSVVGVSRAAFTKRFHASSSTLIGCGAFCGLLRYYGIPFPLRYRVLFAASTPAATRKYSGEGTFVKLIRRSAFELTIKSDSN